MRVPHDAEDVAERIDDGSGDESRASLGDWVVFLRPHREQSLPRRRHVVDVPVDDRARRVQNLWGTLVEVVEPAAVRAELARIGAELTERYGRRG